MKIDDLRKVLTLRTAGDNPVLTHLSRLVHLAEMFYWD